MACVVRGRSFLIVVCGLRGERKVLLYCCVWPVWLEECPSLLFCVACVVRGRSFLIVVCGLCGERKVLPYCSVWPVW